MKSYSAVNLIKRQRNAIDYRENLFESMVSSFFTVKEHRLRINVSHDNYMRLEVFCKDIEELQDNYEFRQSDLVGLLLEEYLTSIRMNTDHSRIYNILSELESKYHSTRGFTNHGNSFFESYTRVEFKTKQVLVDIDKEVILRAEWIFHDLEISYPDHGYTVENFIELLYADFAEAVKSGNLDNAINTILQKVKSWNI